MERGTPPPARVVASLDSSSLRDVVVVVVLLDLDLVLVRLLLRPFVVEARRGRGAALLRVRPPRAPLAGLLLLLLDLVVVVALLGLVLVRLLFSGARPEAWRGRGCGLCVAERWRGAVDVLEILRRGSTLALASSKFFGVSSALTSS